MLYFCFQIGRLPEGHCPTNGCVIFDAGGVEKADVYDKAIELIKKDPLHNICQIGGPGDVPLDPFRR